MRVLVLSTAYREPDVREKYRAIAALGIPIVVASAEPQTSVDNGVRFVAAGARGGAEPGRPVEWPLAGLRKLASDERPDLVHIEADPETRLAMNGARVATALGCPYVVASQRALSPRLSWLARRRAAKVLAGAAGVIGESRLAMELLTTEATGAIGTVIPLGAVAAPTNPNRAPHPELAIGFVGRLVPERGADTLIRALGQTFGRWRLVVVGTGPNQEGLEASVQRLGLAARVQWLGGLRREAITALWPEIDCLVMPSRDTATWVEYSSPVLVDAMGHGVTPVVFRAGCLPDVVGDAGVVVEDAAALGEVLQRWVADPAPCRTLGIRARERILERYIPTAVAAATVDFWRETLVHAAGAAGTLPKGG